MPQLPLVTLSSPMRVAAPPVPNRQLAVLNLQPLTAEATLGGQSSVRASGGGLIGLAGL
jgi:hypothetical protein